MAYFKNKLLFLSIFILVSLQIVCSQLSQPFLKDFTSYAKINPDFQLFWKFYPNETISMAMRWKTPGYFSLGFGSTMDNLDLIIVEKNENEKMILSDSWSKTRKKPVPDISLGGSNDLILLGYIMKDEEGFSMVKFNRKLNTSDKYIL